MSALRNALLPGGSPHLLIAFSLLIALVILDIILVWLGIVSWTLATSGLGTP